ncbi:hypothetical protein V8B55DRAFT_1350209 [Mucor lusitanicus]|uniref:Uncharacterized protein n=1 Tax=Mucor circinelloides f. lusitanicus TaxID=29924 RepID=A0A8H4B7N6_MUCCL|nr:hypothetical protein FB192DRAFT_1405165 [Mucor lusitanicus]
MMKFADRDPPLPRNENNWEPDVDTYYYYLSFLERYIEETKTIPPTLRKVYLVRAEYRYIKWLHNSLYLTPPTDIAFTWHAHMLSPRRYFEDKARSDGQGLLHHELNLDQWHHSYTTAEAKVNKVDWKKTMGQEEPYRLTASNLLDAPHPTMKCIVCSDTITLEWNDYATWRTNPTCAVQCGKCDAMFTIKHVGKANMILDLKKNHLREEINMAGLMFTHYQGDTKIYPQPEAAFFIEACAHRLKSLPFNSGIYTIEALLYDEEGDDGNGAELCADVMDAIRSTYMCSPYRESSIDLLQAVSRLYKFAFRVIEDMEWDIANDIPKGISQYNQFLKTMIKNKHAIPNIYADVFWHTRMMRQNYDRTRINIDKSFNHDSLVPINQMQRYAEATSKQKKPYKATHVQDNANYSKSSMFKGVFSSLKSAKNDDIHDISVHGAEDVEDYVTFDFPYTNANGEFSRVESSQLGFVGTIGGENSDYLDRWIRTKTTPKGQPSLAEDSNYVTYSKVFPSKNGSQKPRPNSTQEPWFHWQKASVAWVYAKSKEEVENSICKALEAAKSREAPAPARGYFTIYGSQDYIPVGEGF